MPKKPRAAPVGATQQPDILDEYLEAWKPEPLTIGFEIEDGCLDALADFTGVDAARGRIARTRLEGVRLASSRLPSLKLTYVVMRDVDVSNADWTGAQLNRVMFEGGRMTGFGGAELQVDDVVFRNCKLDLANFRFSRIRRTTFDNCVLDEADFAGGFLEDTRFVGSQIRRAHFDNARLSHVDFRGSDLQPLGDVLGLRGAIIDSVQLVDLAAVLAQGLGILVEDPGSP